MECVKTALQGVFLIKNKLLTDIRGSFTKTINCDTFVQNGLATEYKESYFSVSNKNVIRGMHFQIPPCDHEKLVYVTNGKIFDVVLDLRTKSESYGKYISIELSYENGFALYIPKGLAHGFKSLADNSVAVYNVTSVYNKDADCGIKWDSFGFDWNVTDPIISSRDQNFVSLKSFISPF